MTLLVHWRSCHQQNVPFIDQVLAETLIRNTVLSRVRHYFRHQTGGEDHAS